MPMSLVIPASQHIASYKAALERGWSPDNVCGKVAAREQLDRIGENPLGFVASLDDPEASGAPIALPDGTFVPRLPGIVRWMWDGDFCCTIGFRWQHGTPALPPHVLGHIGFAVVPWNRRQGYATRALAAILGEARLRCLPWVELTTNPDNEASQRVIAANGGILIEQFSKLPAYGGGEALRYRIVL